MPTLLDHSMPRIDTNTPQSTADVPALPGWLLRYRGVLIWLFHLGMAVVSNYIAFAVRFDGAIPHRYQQLWVNSIGALLVARGAMFVVFRLYEGLWRYTSVHDLINILLGVGISSLLFMGFIEQMGLTSYPRSILLIDALLLTGFAAGVRLAARAHRDLVGGKGGRRVLIYGAGDAGEAVVREMRLSLSRDYHPVALVDDDRSKVGARIHGVPVLGTREDLRTIMKRCRPDEVIVTIPRADPATYRGVVRALEPFKVPIKTLPHLRELLNGNVSTKMIRDLSLEDLLRRAPVGLSREPLLELIQGKTILVTGAGGSIGSELCRQIAALGPDALILYERHENSLYCAVKDLTSGGAAPCTLHAVIGDVTDQSRFRSVLEEYRPATVFHAAAHKHVPLMELNVCEAVKNNVVGTRMAADLSEECGVERFILISSDKAVNPVSVMGTTKRVAELMLQSKASGTRTKFLTVRFGNVLGSNGSVIPLFVEQLKHGGPLTVTHPDVRRYFMLIPEAVQLVLHAAAVGETNSIYVLDMGEPIRLLDVARDLIRLSGFGPDEVPITFIGLRPGEKLDEELVGREEVVDVSPVQSVMHVRPRHVPYGPSLRAQIAGLERSAILGDADAVMAQLRVIVPEFGSADAMPHGIPEVPRVPVPAAQVQTAQISEAPIPIPVVPPSRMRPVATEHRGCAACNSGSLHRSRVSGPFEQLRRQFTAKRPYRCYACGWRGWIEVMSFLPSPSPAAIQPPDLRHVDDAVLKVIPSLAAPLSSTMLSTLDPSQLPREGSMSAR